MKKASVVVLAGQSNAVGVGFVKCLPYHFSEEKIDKLQNGHKNVMINYNSHDKESGGFCPVTFGCSEVAKYTLGPEVGIAENLSLRYPEHEIFIVNALSAELIFIVNGFPPQLATKIRKFLIAESLSVGATMLLLRL